ncbi:hypothetical protein DEJ44_09280 [Streptomyces venezuelae]|uniref:DUF4344 domain-containing metallopeptidase n=1 Tax=Streptomyces venezuelae TaxID=54571 RepID=UPI00123BE6CA|nr:DUF4344 domain-containing metallopeptidase [Streptomyces venezuelae]QES05791.1 hypothetical protein DEJ44_09280 [Streptomyces venezuelae]
MLFRHTWAAALTTVTTLLALAFASPALPAPAVAPAAPGPGLLVVDYQPAATPEDLAEQKFLQENEVLESAAAHANALIGLPADVPLTATSCDEVNAYWDPESGSITFCYGLVSAYRGLFGDLNTTGTEAQRNRATEDDLIGISNSVVFHEFGHALIDIYELPSTGREEDAADQLATLLLAGDSLHQGYAVSAIEAWGALARASEQGDLTGQLADEHSLDAQRYYNAICWLYGSDPATYEGVVVQTSANPEAPLPESRAVRCPDEYDKINRAWSTLLQPYLKT